MSFVSSNPANAIGRSDLGDIAPRKRATLTIIDARTGSPWQALGMVRDGKMRASFFAQSGTRAELIAT